VQALKDTEDPLRMFWIDTDAIIAHRKHPVLSVPAGCDMNSWGCLAVKLQRVAHEVLQHEP